MFMDKANFLKKAKQRRPLYSCSRIRVGEVSHREEGTNKFKEILQKTFKDRTRKRGATNMKNTWQIWPKLNQHPRQIHPKIGQRLENGDWQLGNGDGKLENGQWKPENLYRKLKNGDLKPESGALVPVSGGRAPSIRRNVLHLAGYPQPPLAPIY